MNFLQANRLNLVKIIVCLGLGVGFLVTKPLWISTRAYPLTPIFTWVPIVAFPYDELLYFLLFILLIWIAIRQNPINAIKLFLFISIYLAAADQSRWHPWFYWFTFMLLALTQEYSNQSKGREELALNICRIILISSYLWAGFQKVNVTFYYSLFPWVMSAFIHNPESHFIWSKVPFVIPITEVSTGILLLLPKYRNLGVIMAILMHGVILIFLGPFGHSVNTNIWGWNIVLLLLTPVLFYQTPLLNYKQILVSRSFIHILVLILFLFMPLFTFFNRWDAYLGFSLYSGSQRAAYFQLDDVSKHKLPPALQSYINSDNQLIASKWTMGELNTPDYAEPRIYKSLLTYICQYTEAELVIMSKPDRFTGSRLVEFTTSCPKKDL